MVKMRKYLWIILLILGLTALSTGWSFASEEEDDGWWKLLTEGGLKINSNTEITLKGNIEPQAISGMRGFRLSLSSFIISF